MLHYDDYENLLCQIRGSKELIIFPPKDLKNLYYVGRRKGKLKYEFPGKWRRCGGCFFCSCFCSVFGCDCGLNLVGLGLVLLWRNVLFVLVCSTLGSFRFDSRQAWSQASLRLAGA